MSRAEDDTPTGSETHLIVVISGPSGVGKDVLIERMASLRQDFHFTVTATTRNPRPNEVQGVNHHFVSEDEFNTLIESDELLEWARVYGNYYGVPKQQVRDALEQKLHVIVRVDVQGAMRIKEIVPDALMLFINAPDMRVLVDRLRRRGVNSESDMRTRLDAAEYEIRHADRFDSLIINHEGRLDRAVEEVVAIIEEESRRIPPRKMNV